MSGTRGFPDDEALRTEIQAAIAAGRELGPDMDRHLADSVIERYRKEQTTQTKALAPRPTASPPVRPFDGEEAGRILLPLAGLAAFVAIVVLRPEYWWMIFFLPMLGSWWGWDRWSHRKRPHRKRG